MKEIFVEEMVMKGKVILRDGLTCRKIGWDESGNGKINGH
jgi:hypothetical protein